MWRTILAATLASLALSGCSTLLWETGLPWTQADFMVNGVVQRGPFLDVRVVGGGIERRLFTRDSEECRSLLRTEATVTLRHTDGYGPFEREGVECPVVGIGDLEKLRGSRSRGGGYGTSPIRRGRSGGSKARLTALVGSAFDDLARNPGDGCDGSDRRPRRA